MLCTLESGTDALGTIGRDGRELFNDDQALFLQADDTDDGRRRWRDCSQMSGWDLEWKAVQRNIQCSLDIVRLGYLCGRGSRGVD